MDIASLKEELIQDTEKVILILEKLGCDKIHYSKGNAELRASIDNEPSSNGNSIRIKLDTLSVVSFSDRLNCQGDILTLVQTYKNCKLNEAIKYVCDILGLEYSLEIKKKECIFGGYFEGLKSNLTDDTPLQTYPHSILDQYDDVPNRRFLKDGISLETQLKYEIMYDNKAHRIVIPWWNELGELIGCMGRYNADNFDSNIIPKYLPLIPFSKSKCVYGFYQNYNHLVNSTIIIMEAEKSVLKADTEGFYKCVAIGSHNISKEQINLIRGLNPTSIIIAYDKDISDENYLIEQCKRFKENILFFANTKVGYVLDKEHKYLEDGTKLAPIDKGIGVFKDLIKNCLYWV